MDVRAFLVQHLNQFSAAPFLFIGSGLSRRYLKLEDWQGLLRRFAEPTGKPYEFYQASADGHLPRAASLIARDFHHVWWTEPQFGGNREAHKSDCSRFDSALKIEISQYMLNRSNQLPADEALRDELELLSKAVVDGVITTNWDKLLEDIFSDYEVFIGQDELIFSATQGIGEIYKIHGSCSRPNSLVLTDEDYARFHERNPYLAAKLLTTFVEHPIIFLGYSLSDNNVRSVLRAIASCLTDSTIAELRNRLLFVQWEPGRSEVNTDAAFVMDGFTLPVVTIKTGEFLPVFAALAATERRFPAKLLRRLKRHVYDLVLTNNAREKIHVLDIDADGDMSQVRVVFGVGAASADLPATGSAGYKPIGRLDLLRDVIFQDAGYDCARIVEETLPRVLKAARFVPVFRYLAGADRFDSAGVIIPDGLDARLLRAARADMKRFAPPTWNRKKATHVRALGMNFEQYAATHTAHEVVNYAPLLPEASLDPDAILRFVQKNIALLDATSVDQTQFIKLICLFDYLKYAPSAQR